MCLRDTLERPRPQILAAAAANGADSVRVFGSVARGDNTAESDVDFLVHLQPGRSLLDLASVSKGRQAALDGMKHIIAAADAIAGYVARGRSVFAADDAMREAIVYQIVVIGEAAKAVVAADPSVTTEIPSVEWSLLARMRDKVTHGYRSAGDSDKIHSRWATPTDAAIL